MARQVVSDQDLLDAYAKWGSYKGAARALGLDRNTVRSRLQRLALKDKGAPPPEGFKVTKVAQRGDGSVIAVQSKPAPEEAFAKPVPHGHEVKGVSTLFGADGEVVGQWVKTRQAEVSQDELLEAVASHMERYVFAQPDVKLVAPGSPSSKLCNVFAWGDPHIGLLSHARETGRNFDLKIATRNLQRSAEVLVQRAPIAREAVFLEVGDLWHAENDKQLTPRGGNKLDVDGRKTKILEEGLACTRGMINLLLATHQHVTIVLVPGNHDPDLALITRLWLAAVYEANERVTILDNANPWMYHRFGDNLFGFNHGDKKVKPQELGEMFLVDRSRDAGECRHRRFFTGHVHHKNVGEFRWGRWESFNSLCAPDFWHHSEGYRSERACEVITFHETFGEQGRQRVTHDELQA